MIEHIRHRGLKRLYGRGDRSSIGANMHDRVERILLILDQLILDQAETVAEMDIPGYRLHALTGNR